MAYHWTNCLRAFLVLIIGAVSLSGCTSNESEPDGSNVTLRQRSGSGNQLAERIAAIAPKCQIRRLAPVRDVRTVALTRDADFEGPMIAGPRLSSSTGGQETTSLLAGERHPELLRLPPVDTDAAAKASSEADAQPVTPASSIPIPRMRSAPVDPTPWRWRSTIPSRVAPSSDGEHVQIVPDSRGRQGSRADCPTRLPPPSQTLPLSPASDTGGASSGPDLRGSGTSVGTAFTPAPAAADGLWANAAPELPPATAGQNPPATGPSLADALSQARTEIERGVELADRKALYSARAEFIQALRTIARANDRQGGQAVHVRALTAALQALREAQDFIPRDPEMEAEIDVRRYLPAHRTPVFKNEIARKLTPQVAQLQYHVFARKQLVLASGGQPIAAEALVQLGKVSLQLYRDEPDTLGGPTALAFYRAAETVDDENAQAARELGVLLASRGRLQQARKALLRSISIQPTAEAWHDLSEVHRQLGEVDLAARAAYESRLARQVEGGWPSEFAADQSPPHRAAASQGEPSRPAREASNSSPPAASTSLPGNSADVGVESGQREDVWRGVTARSDSVPPVVGPASDLSASPPPPSRQAVRKGWKRLWTVWRKP